MGRRGKWFATVKKALSRKSKEKNDQTTKTKKKWRFGKSKQVEGSASASASTVGAGNELQRDQAYRVAIASAAAAEAAAAAAQAAAEVVRISTARNPGRGREETAAIKIQTAFRGYLARRALRCLKGLARMESLMKGSRMNHQVRATLQNIHTYNKVQSQIRSRRIISYDNKNQVIQKRVHLQRDKALKASVEEDWNLSPQSKQHEETKLLQREEAAIRRERTLAYALAHQQRWRKQNKNAPNMFIDATNTQWGWSWLERWMAARSGDAPSLIEKEFDDSGSSVKSAPRSSMKEAHTSYALRALNIDKSSPKSSKLSTTPRQGFSASPLSKASTPGKSKAWNSKLGKGMEQDDTRSVKSFQSEKYRRQSIAGSPARDGESQGSSPPAPSYLASTASTRAKSRLPSSPGRLAFQPSPGRTSRSPGSPKLGV